MRRPSDLYNWYCVLHSVTSITHQAANIRVQQLASCQLSIGSTRTEHAPDHVGQRPAPSKASQRTVDSLKRGSTLPKENKITADQGDELTLREKEMETADISPTYFASQSMGQMANLDLEPTNENLVSEKLSLSELERPETGVSP